MVAFKSLIGARIQANQCAICHEAGANSRSFRFHAHQWGPVSHGAFKPTYGTILSVTFDGKGKPILRVQLDNVKSPILVSPENVQEVN